MDLENFSLALDRVKSVKNYYGRLCGSSLFINGMITSYRWFFYGGVLFGKEQRFSTFLDRLPDCHPEMSQSYPFGAKSL